MKILITGGKGMLGRTLQRELGEKDGHEIVVADLPEWDILADSALFARFLAEKPDLVIHAAAMTDVDKCEQERDMAFALNEDGSRNVALAAKACGARLIAISTDYVFSGEPPREPWAWSETDMPRPRTVYGLSKFAGEQMVSMLYPDAVILRISWLYGAGGPSFVHTMAKLGAEKDTPPIKVVDDQRGNPTSAKTVADVIRFLIKHPSVSGIVHGTCEEQCSWHDLALEVKALLGPNFPREVIPCATEEFPRPAPRPRNSALKKSVLNVLGYRTPPWRQALAEFIAEEFPSPPQTERLYAKGAEAGRAKRMGRESNGH